MRGHPIWVWKGQDFERRDLQAEGAVCTEAAQTRKDGVWQGTGLRLAVAAAEPSGGGDQAWP